jgi:hypothetical protein
MSPEQQQTKLKLHALVNDEGPAVAARFARSCHPGVVLIFAGDLKATAPLTATEFVRAYKAIFDEEIARARASTQRSFSFDDPESASRDESWDR